MKIDEKRLEEMKLSIELQGVDRAHTDEKLELIRLARLGLWASRELRADVRHSIEDGADFIHWITPGGDGEPVASHCMRFAARTHTFRLGDSLPRPWRTREKS